MIVNILYAAQHLRGAIALGKNPVNKIRTGCVYKVFANGFTLVIEQ
jgi:hypothetical protein